MQKKVRPVSYGPERCKQPGALIKGALIKGTRVFAPHPPVDYVPETPSEKRRSIRAVSND